MDERSSDSPSPNGYPADMNAAGQIENPGIGDVDVLEPAVVEMIAATARDLEESIPVHQGVILVDPVRATPSAELDAADGPDLSLAAEATPQSKRLLPSRVYAKRQKAIRVAEISEEQIETYLTELATTGLKELSAQRAGLSARIINRIKAGDHEFKVLCDEAMAMYIDDVVGELHRRAVAGWDEPVFSQKLGTQIGVIRKYDGKLLELLVKRHDPAFREKFEGEVKVTGGVLVIPAGPTDINAWVQSGQKGTSVQPSPTDATPPAQLPAPESSKPA
jgi:hypothetical protein